MASGGVSRRELRQLHGLGLQERDPVRLRLRAARHGLLRLPAAGGAHQPHLHRDDEGRQGHRRRPAEEVRGQQGRVPLHMSHGHTDGGETTSTHTHTHTHTPNDGRSQWFHLVFFLPEEYEIWKMVWGDFNVSQTGVVLITEPYVDIIVIFYVLKCLFYYLYVFCLFILE